MDTVERLPLESVRVPSLILCEHRHRYELAAEALKGLRVLDLCCGVGYGSELLSETAAEVLGVDNAVGAIETAREAFGSDTVRFEVADAVGYLRTAAAETFDAIVCFEGLEHLPDVDAAFVELRRHAARGAKLVLSVPNSIGLGESNDYHVTDFDQARAMREFAAFGSEVRVLSQFLAEGSVLLEQPGDLGDTSGGMVFDDDVELEYANHYVAFVNVAPPTDAATSMKLATSPLNHRYVRSLERANAELARANARLARRMLGSADSAAAAVLWKVRAGVYEELEEKLDELREELHRANEGRGYAETLAREAWQREKELEQRIAELEARHAHPLRRALGRVLKRR